jgi:hypothetical protein
MTPEFLLAVVDTLLPGEVAARAGEQNLPAGSAAGVDLGKYAEALQPILQAILGAAGDAPAFVAASETRRIDILQSVQREAPEAFARLLTAALPDYYETPVVLNALGWRSEPPQPKGHIVPAMDDTTRARLERVISRGKRWRDGA